MTYPLPPRQKQMAALMRRLREYSADDNIDADDAEQLDREISSNLNECWGGKRERKRAAHLDDLPPETELNFD